MREAILEQVYAFIEDYIRQVGFSPTVREIAIRCGLSLQKTTDALSMLEARGKITRVKGTQRNIRIRTRAAN